MFYFSAKKITLETIAQAHYADSPLKIKWKFQKIIKYVIIFFLFSYLRYDSLALFLHHSNIIPESNILIIEKTKGLVLAAVAQRLNCKGEITFAFNEEVKKPLNQIACFNQLNLCKNKNENIKLVELENVLANPDAKNTFSQYF